MKKILFVCIVSLSLVFAVSCGGDDNSCEQNEDCTSGYICDQSIKECVLENAPEEDEGRTNENEGGASEGETPEGAADGTEIHDGDADNSSTGIYVECTPGEEFKLRMAIWDTNDHVLDSMVILDNFTWYESAQKPGIAPK